MQVRVATLNRHGSAAVLRTCLVVDDSRVIRKVARRIVEDLGFEATEAGDGLEALAWCRAEMPTAILLDWNMPVMNGLEFVRRLREEPGGDRPKVIFCSVETDLSRVSEALDAGADDYLMKPFDSALVASRFGLVGLG